MSCLTTLLQRMYSHSKPRQQSSDTDFCFRLGDLIGFQGFLNETTPFRVTEHQALWKSDRHYVDFMFGNDYNETCDYPRLWLEDGFPVGPEVTDQLKGCYDSDFDQYGDLEAFGVYPDWQRQLTKFASVQDRLREWIPSVRERIIRHSCLMITQFDIDGFRYDKATQATVDALGDMSGAYRECARKVGKHNFFLPGEITGGNTFGAIYVGRGRQAGDMILKDHTDGFRMTNESNPKHFIRDQNKAALDAGAFHYTIYRSLTRFLGMDGNLQAGYDSPVTWVAAWEDMLKTNDFVNVNTGKFDPRHMYGATNQDVFRWPTIRQGTERMLLAMYITTLHLPGIPLLLWGEEQAFYVLDNTAKNYIFGRQAMSPATAWQTHGCYTLGSEQYYQWPIESGKVGCHDDTVSYDHRDPSHPVRNILKAMYQMRDNFPSLNDGWEVQELSKQTHEIFLPGSKETATETGLWSVLRGPFEEMQDFGKRNQSVWLVYHNDNKTVNYKFDCSSKKKALVSAFETGTTVKNLFYPYDELELKDSPEERGYAGSTKPNGCVDSLELEPYGFKAYVPKEKFVDTAPTITKFSPGHDSRIKSTVAPDEQESVKIELQFSTKMDCDDITTNIELNSTTESGKQAKLDTNTVKCDSIKTEKSNYVGEIPGKWMWSANLTGVYNGVHKMSVKNVTSAEGGKTNAIDHFLFRIGQTDNPMVFTRTANYSTSLLHRDGDDLLIRHHAAGADLYRYTLDWGTTFSDWLPYKGGNDTLEKPKWSGTKLQRWEGEHVSVEYWNRMTGSSSHVQAGDLDWDSKFPRRFPHLFWNGPFNQYGYDAGLKNHLEQDKNDGKWKFEFMTEWPAVGQLNMWGINPDSKPDQSWVFGDADGDSILDRLPPSSLKTTLVNITDHPPTPYLAWQISLDDGDLRFQLLPVGSMHQQLVLYILLWIIPILTASTAIYVFKKSFYRVKFNQVGITEKGGLIPLALKRKFNGLKGVEGNPLMKLANKSGFLQENSAFGVDSGTRRMVLIATMEYDIEDWAIKIKIGGLGVMAQLMGKNLGHQDLIWIVPCVGGVDYPVDQVAEPMFVTILGNSYEVQVQYHVLRNITYVLLDAPVFRKQTKNNPYPERMDDLESAIYYSAWNQCVALAIERFPIDLYHINDYHGSIAPLYLLPKTIPSCLSLHNAEFQGLWPMRTQKEKQEVCSVFNLDPDVATRYVQFGEVFNLLHAGASYLRVHQQGFGAVGVSKKYGKRSYARYPIFWGLKRVGNLPNPDPSDTGEWDKVLPKDSDINVDPAFESSRGELRRQAQEWAGLDQDPDAELLVFVGRWSMQKGVDLIADVLPSVLEARKNVQVICVGPVIDLHGKFAAMKLAKLMDIYPGRVFSKPEFTALPPFIFSGAEFALIPSRDEPFGLVAVEFGRKGALGIGARVGGLGQMPGWWYTVESTTTTHLLQQFKLAIESALNSKQAVRAKMRARSAKQRFPVAQWVEDLEVLQSSAIRLHNKQAKSGGSHSYSNSGYNTPSGMMTPPIGPSGTMTPTGAMTPPLAHSRDSSYSNIPNLNTLGPQARNTIVYSRDTSPNPTRSEDNTTKPKSGLSRQLSLGVRSGPGHAHGRERGRRGSPSERENEQQAGGTVADIEEDSDEDMIPSYYGDEEYTITPEQAEAGRRVFHENQPSHSPHGSTSNTLLPPRHSSHGSHNSFSQPRAPQSPSTSPDMSLLPPPNRPFADPSNRLSSASVLSLDSVVGDKKDYNLQKVDPFFTDSAGEFGREFERRLEGLTAANSEKELCIEEYLVKSQKKWYGRFRDARLGRSHSPASSIFHGKGGNSPAPSIYNDVESQSDKEGGDEFLLGKDYVPPTGLKKWMLLRIGDWPIYSFFLGFGQIIAANSYQITLLTGEVGQTAEKLYAIATTYLITSCLWWLAFRSFKSVISLSLPFVFYGLGFLFIGLAHFASSETATGWIQNVGTGFYAAASSSGSIFFSLNFGDESGAPVKDWVFRACMIQGTQQIYVVALWYWGSTLTKAQAIDVPQDDPISGSWKMT